MGKTVAILANLDPSGYADMTAIAASSTAMAAVTASSTAMTAVAASSVATSAIAASTTALTAIAGSTTALDALYAKKSRLTGASASKSGKFIILEISSNSAFDTSQYGYATLSDGSKLIGRIIRVSTPTLSSSRRSPHTSKTIPKVMTGSTIFRAVDGLKQPVLCYALSS